MGFLQHRHPAVAEGGRYGAIALFTAAGAFSPVFWPAMRDSAKALAGRPGIAAAISGMVTEVFEPEIDESTLRAYFEETLALFGPDRLLFGTDWPVCLLRIDSYKSWADMVRGFVSELSSDESDAILHDNAVRIYGL